MMGGRWPWVSRRAYDDAVAALELERARADRLEHSVLTMRRSGFGQPPKATITQPPPDPATTALRDAERAFIENAKAAVLRARPDLSPGAADREARRLRDNVVDDGL